MGVCAWIASCVGVAVPETDTPDTNCHGLDRHCCDAFLRTDSSSRSQLSRLYGSWPTLAAPFVIVAGHTKSSFGADTFLSWKPLVKLGDSSYALYLVHWPVLVFFLIVSDRDHAGPVAGTLIIVGSIVAAIIVTKLIDAPLRRNKWIEQKRSRAVLTIATCVALVALLLGAWQWQIHERELALEAQAQAAQADVQRNYPGALSLQHGFVDSADPDLPMTPALTALDDQWVSLTKRCEADFATNSPFLEKSCGQTESLPNPDKLIVIVGDSHSEQFSGALIPLAEKNDWQLVSVLLGGCDFGSEDVESGRATECREFNKAAMDYILKHKPDAVFTVATDAAPDSPEETIIPGYEQAVQTFTEAEIEVIGIRDNPRFSSNKASCVAKSGADACMFQQSDYLAGSNPAESLKEIPGAHMIDLTDQYCKDGTCPAVAGNVMVYLDDNHLTWDYARTMAPALGERIAASTGWKVE